MPLAVSDHHVSSLLHPLDAHQFGRNSVGAGRVCGVVVAYFPDAGFVDRLAVLRTQVDELVVVDNTNGQEAAWCDSLPATVTAQIHLIGNAENLGIAAALNQGLHHALATGCYWLLTLDQDTHSYPDMVSTLCETWLNCPFDPVVIGGNYFDTKRKRHDAALDAPTPCQERKTVITSGCLVNAQFAQAIGGFRDDYFIDQVDHEFCLRARAHGGRVVISTRPVMDHSVGGHTGPKLPLIGWMLPEHSPLRKYYITRNTIATLATYWWREPEWCLRRLVRLLIGIGSIMLLEKDTLSKLRAFVAGLVDGVRGRMGPCNREWLAKRTRRPAEPR